MEGDFSSKSCQTLLERRGGHTPAMGGATSSHLEVKPWNEMIYSCRRIIHTTVKGVLLYGKYIARKSSTGNRRVIGYWRVHRLRAGRSGCLCRRQRPAG